MTGTQDRRTLTKVSMSRSSLLVMAVEDLVLVAFMAYITRVWKVFETVKAARTNVQDQI